MNIGIGGYNQIKLSKKNNFVPDFNTFQSARSALFSYLQTAEVECIHLPFYICDSLVPCIRYLGIEIKWYEISDDLLPTVIPILNKNERFLIVNYFGLKFKEISCLNFKQPEKVVIDNSQSLFSPHIPKTTSIYSPRKYLGVPDGGWVISDVYLEEPEKKWSSEDNLSHLLLRDAGMITKGYEKFIKAEQALTDYIPQKMSDLTKHLIQCSDIDYIKTKRINNYNYLYDELYHINEFNIPLNDNVPLCYPLHCKEDISEIHTRLVDVNVYTPRYWLNELNVSKRSHLYNNTLFLPVDERLSTNELSFICELLKKEMSNEL